MDLSAFLDAAAREELPHTLRYQELAERERYYQGTQYQGRQLDAGGYFKGNPAIFGSGMRTPPWSDRDPGPVWKLHAQAVREITAWAVGGESFCHLEIADDDEAEDWLAAVGELAGLPDAIAKARNYGGSQGTAIVSFAIRQGRIFLEAHNPKLCWVLDWRDPATHRPRVVAQVYWGDNPMARSAADRPLLCRIWDESREWVMERVKGSQDEPWRWEEVDSVLHGYGFCPVYWHPQDTEENRHDGEPDGDRCEGEVDEANELFAAAGANSKRNADDTVVIKTSPANNPGTTRVGAYNTIYSENGAEYLSQSGDSAKICVELAKARAEHVWASFGVVMPSLDTLGKATTAELMKRLFQRTANTAGAVRRDYARGLIIPLCQGLLAAGRRLAGRRQALLMPPRVEAGADSSDRVVTPRTPGVSSFVQCVWPAPFPPTTEDTSKVVTTAATAVTAGILSQETAVRWLVLCGLPIEDVAAELVAIATEKEAAQKVAMDIAAAAPPKPGLLSAKANGEAPSEGGKVAAE